MLHTVLAGAALSSLKAERKLLNLKATSVPENVPPARATLHVQLAVKKDLTKTPFGSNFLRVIISHLNKI